MWSWFVLFYAVATVQSAPSDYTVPVPTIDVYSPKGLRISIPDEPEISSVDFRVEFSKALTTTDPGTVNSDHGRWTYWNPNISIKAADLLNYKITANRGGLNWTRRGTHFVDKVISLSDNSVVETANCDEDTQQQIASFPVFEDADEEKNLAANGAKQSNLKSSYSMFKTMDSRPITRSSTSTTSGTFYIKPTGDIEGGGYKSSSSFDSTRHEGDQWQHSKSELSTAELDELKRLHGDDFFKLPAYSHLQYGDAHGGGSGTISSYRKSSSYSSSSQSHPTITSGSAYNQVGQTQLGQTQLGISNLALPQIGLTQTGSSPTTYPILRPTDGAGGYSTYSKYEKHQTSHSPVITGQYNEQSLISNSGDYDVPPESSSGYKTVQTKYNKQETVKTTGEAVPVYPAADFRKTDTSYGYSTPERRPTGAQPLSGLPSSGSSIRKTETYEYSSAPQTSVPNVPIGGKTYIGEIFRTTIRPLTPSSCSSSDFLGAYKNPSSVDVVALEKNVHELQCLSVLAENTLKSEIRTLRQENGDLVVRIRDLEQQFRRFRDECKCY